MSPSTRSKCCLHIVADLDAVARAKSLNESFAKERNLIRPIRPRQTAGSYGDLFRIDARRLHRGVSRVLDHLHRSR